MESHQTQGQTKHNITNEQTVHVLSPETNTESDDVGGDDSHQAMERDSSPSNNESPSRAQKEERSKKAQALTVDNPNPPSAPLWCPVKGRSHANLTEFGINLCPSCQQNLEPPEAIKADQQREQGSGEGSNYSRSVDPGSDAPHTKYSIRFLDDAGGHFSDQTWHEILDLDRAREKLSHRSDPIVEVVSVVSTSMSAEWSKLRNPPEREKLIREGLLTNPDYAMELDHRLVVVRSEHIIRALKQIVTYWPGVTLSGNSITLREPYALFYHHRDKIEAYRKTYRGAQDDDDIDDPIVDEKSRPGFKPCDEETHQHLKALADAIESQNLNDVRKEINRHRQHPAVTTHEMLWLLLKPGTTVYKRRAFDHKLRACVVKSCESIMSLGEPCCEVTVWRLEYDGRFLGRRAEPERIRFFDGEKRVMDLPVFPAEYYDSEDGGALRRALEASGERYFELISRPQQVDYRGKTLGEGQWYEGRAVLDPRSYYSLLWHPQVAESIRRPEVSNEADDSIMRRFLQRQSADIMRKVSGSKQGDNPEGDNDEDDRHNSMQKPIPGISWEGYDYIDPYETDTLDLIDQTTGDISKHRYLLCPSRVVGFILKSRKWEELDVQCCSDIKFNTAAIDSVVMPEERKMIIESLVYRYTDIKTARGKTPSWTADFIENKGEGQIFLLHGGPGVGKTFTAECIAESTSRPLLSLTCGDIGTSEDVAEERLSKWFKLAEIWGAVMLLDEADVFLEKRATSDLERNSLVSIFLRMMEYYRGILFLTTNRVGHFDDAFVSRVHMVIEYQNLSEPDRERIWTQFFNKLQKERGRHIGISGRAKRYVLKDPEVTQIPWNGREIRNAFQTAVAFAEYRFAHTPEDERDAKACLEQEDFEKVCEMTGAFKKYLTAISGYDEATRARLDQARNDNFKSDRLR